MLVQVLVARRADPVADDEPRAADAGDRAVPGRRGGRARPGSWSSRAWTWCTWSYGEPDFAPPAVVQQALDRAHRRRPDALHAQPGHPAAARGDRRPLSGDLRREGLARSGPGHARNLAGHAAAVRRAARSRRRGRAERSRTTPAIRTSSATPTACRSTWTRPRRTASSTGRRRSQPRLTPAHAGDPRQLAGQSRPAPCSRADRMAAIAALAASGGPFIVADEIYHGLTDGGRDRSILEFTDRAFVLNGFSKAFAMTGWRLGWRHRPAQSRARAAAALRQLLHLDQRVRAVGGRRRAAGGRRRDGALPPHLRGASPADDRRPACARLRRRLRADRRVLRPRQRPPVLAATR